MSQNCPIGEKSLLVQPSSAASERIFSLLNNSFTSQQESSLKDLDYIQLSVMTIIALKYIKLFQFFLLQINVVLDQPGYILS